jgi:hypothetical protein
MAMQLDMVVIAEPPHLERLGVVVMVHLRGATTDLTRLALEQPTP